MLLAPGTVVAILGNRVAPPFVSLVLDANDDAPHAAFTVLYARQAPRIHRFLRDLLGDAALAADATQETFARAYQRHRDILRDEERAVPWLFGVARNVSLELRKARARAGRVFVDGDVRIAEAPAPGTPEREVLGREAVRVIDSALGRLSEERRAMLLLRLDHDFSYEQIAELMGFTLAKVKVEIHRARIVLREAIEQYQRGART
jgi:RNA polymerase sigma-70 factor, ECF subfamily